MRIVLALVPLLAACGGSSGGDSPAPPVVTALSWNIDAVEIGANDDAAAFTFECVEVPTPAPVLLEVRFRLPPELELVPLDRLRPATQVSFLDGDVVGDAFVVLCGDANDPDAAPLQPGPLFEVRVQPRPPRRPGSYKVELQLVQAATADGQETQVAAPTTPAAMVTVE